MTNLIEDLRQFTGGMEFYRHPLNRKAVYTEGVQYLAQKAGAYWLIDDICAAYQLDPAIKGQQFQVWKLTVKEDDRSAKLRVEDGDCKHIKTFEIGFTDFPLPNITLWFIDGTLLLPSEY